MADFTTIKNKIATIIEAQTTYFASGSVYTYEPEIENVVTDPFCVLIASGNENDYATTLENRRTYGFSARIFVDRGRGLAEAETLMTSIVGALVDAFDADYTLGGTVLYLTAAPSAWGYVLREKEYRVAEIKLQAKTDFSVS